MNERLRTNKKIVLEKENTVISEILYALRSAPRNDILSPAELQLRLKLNTVKDIITTKPKNYSFRTRRRNRTGDERRSY